MTTKLYVGNLQWKVTDDDLKEVFGQCGKVVTATVILDRDTSRSRGFGFVEMSTPEEAQKAITDLNGKDIKGRQIIIRQAVPEGTETRIERKDDYMGQPLQDFISGFLKDSIPDEETDFSFDGKQFKLKRLA